MENNEIIVHETNENQNNLDFSSDNILMLAEQAEKRISAVKKIMNAALSITHENDWVLIGGKPYLQETGSSKIARLFGVKWEFIGNNPQVEVDAEGYKTFTYRMAFYMSNDKIECEGSRSMREDFFAKIKDTEKSTKDKTVYKLKKPDEIDERDVKMAACTNCINKGIKRLIPGVRNIGINELKNAGLDIEQISGYIFKTGTQGGKDNKKSDSELKCSDCGESVSQTVASYSQGAFGKILCMKCQKKAKQSEKQATEEVNSNELTNN